MPLQLSLIPVAFAAAATAAAISKRSRATEAHFAVMSRCHVAMSQLPFKQKNHTTKAPTTAKYRNKQEKNQVKSSENRKNQAWNLFNGTLTLAYQDVHIVWPLLAYERVCWCVCVSPLATLKMQLRRCKTTTPPYPPLSEFSLWVRECDLVCFLPNLIASLRFLVDSGCDRDQDS